MKVCSFIRADGTWSYGTIEGGHVFDAGAELVGVYADLKSVIAAGALAELAGIGARLRAADVTMLPPVPNADRIICLGANYLPDIIQSGRQRPKHPQLFTRHPLSLVGDGVPLERPRVSKAFDFEGELAVVIGKGGRRIARENVMDHVAGFACFNDGSIRDFQRHSSQYWAGKNFDRSGAMGAVATPESVGDIRDQTLVTRVNGTMVQCAPISVLAISIPDIINYVSGIQTLLPGDIIVTGTPGGTGHSRDPKLYLEPGMTVEVEITGVGLLRNGVVEESL